MSFEAVAYDDVNGDPRTSWSPVDLASVLAGDDADTAPSILKRTDGVALLYRGKIHTIQGEPESMKSFVALEGTRQELEAGNRVMYVDFEDSARGIVARLQAMGVGTAHITEGFTYHRPVEKLTDQAWEELTEVLDAGPTLAVIDGVTESMTVEGLSLEKNADVAEFYERLPRRLERLGPAVVLLDHVTKSKDGRGRFAIGGQHKLAGVSGASYSIEAINPFGRNREGLARLYVAKDRLGWVSEHERGQRRLIAEIVSTSGPDGVSISIEPPPEHSDTFRPTFLMERLSRMIEETPGLSKNALRQSVKGKAAVIDLALELLVAEEYVRIETGSNRSHLHHNIKPFREHEQTSIDREELND